MRNACGFFCCAYDGFSGCGCEGCPNPECWPEEDDDDYEPLDCACGYCGPNVFACEAVDAPRGANQQSPNKEQ